MLPPISALVLAFSMPLSSHGVAIRKPAIEPRQVEATYDPVPLRIMPVGASITFGFKSTDGNGYRKYLRDALVSDGFVVNIVGTQKGGTMRDNENEGYTGKRIEEVTALVTTPLDLRKPNIVLLNLGTNDAAQNFDVPNAGARMETLLNLVYTQSPIATIVLSTLLPNKVAATDVNVNIINEQYKKLVERQKRAGRRILLAEMNGSNGLKLATDFIDDTHPNDDGNKKMAKIFTKAVEDAVKAGLIQRAPKVAGVPDNGA